MGHSHDTNGRREQADNEMKVGNEMVTYEKVHCTCGKYMENNVISKRPVD